MLKSSEKLWSWEPWMNKYVVQNLEIRQGKELEKNHLRDSFRALFTSGSIRRDIHHVDKEYSQHWEASLFEREKKHPTAFPLSYNGKYFTVNPWFTLAVYSDVLNQIVTKYRPESVLEVGVGRGDKLGILSLIHPGIAFSGLEYTATGVQRCQELLSAPSVEHQFIAEKLSGNPVASPILNCQCIQGDAFAMPYGDKSFDLSFTCLVLEQMPVTYVQAIREMARVTRKKCVFIEAFRDCNGWRQLLHLKRMDYFRWKAKEFEKYGLRLISLSADIPQKLTFNAGVLVAEPI